MRRFYLSKISVTSANYGQRYNRFSNIIMRLCQILLLGGQLGLRKCFCKLTRSARVWPQHKICLLGSPAQHAKLYNAVKQKQMQHGCIYSRLSCKRNVSLSRQNAFKTVFLTGGKIYTTIILSCSTEH